MDTDLTKVVWEKRKKGGLAPSSRSGCSMTHWAAKGMGVLFGGVHDEEEKEDMKSVFYNDLQVLLSRCSDFGWPTAEPSCDNYQLLIQPSK